MLEDFKKKPEKKGRRIRRRQYPERRDWAENDGSLKVIFQGGRRIKS